MISCLSVIGKENEPLYIRTFSESKGDTGLRFHYHVHSAVDVVEEKRMTLFRRHQWCYIFGALA
jgi:hypothetical protein